MTIKRANGGGLGGSGSPGGALGSFYSHTIDQSVRLDDSSGAHLVNAAASPTATNRKKVTISCWIKRSALAQTGVCTIFHGSTNGLMMQLNSSDQIYLYESPWQITSDRKFRDVGAWMHIALILDSTQSTDSDRSKLYINGELQDLSTWSVGAGANRYPALNYSFTWHTGTTMRIGSVGDTQDLAGYLAEFISIDGQDTSISDFGETKDGVWVPKDVSGLTLGDAGFYLPFSQDRTVSASTFFSDSGNSYVEFSNASHYDIGSSDDFTIEFWFWPTVAGSTDYAYVVGNYVGTSGPHMALQCDFRTSNRYFYFYYGNGAADQFQYSTGDVDAGRWHHVAVNRNSGTLELFLDGARVGSAVTSHTRSYGNDNFRIGQAQENGSNGFDGYLSNVRMVVGSAVYSSGSSITVPTSPLTAVTNTKLLALTTTTITADGSTNNVTGTVSGSGYFATDGLSPFPNAAFNEDAGSNGIDFSAKNIFDYDVVPDSPTNNFATMNPLFDGNSAVLSEGNLKVATGGFSSSKYGTISTFAIPKDKKIYVEVECTDTTGSDWTAGFATKASLEAGPGSSNIGSSGAIMVYNRQVEINDEQRQYTSSDGLGGTGVSALAAGDILGMMCDGATGKVWFSRNGTYFKYISANNTTAGNIGDPDNDTDEIGTITGGTTDDIFVVVSGGTPADDIFVNFGQDSTNVASAQSDANGIGTFEYAPPTDYVCLCSSSLTDSTIGPGQGSQADDHFNTVLYTGTGATQSITGVGFQPDWVFVKRRAGVQEPSVTDSVRGVNAQLRPAATNVESTSTNSLTSFDSDGFTLGADATNSYNHYTDAHVAWNWKAGTSVSGTTTGSGTGQSYTGSVNTDAGFSIIAYTGNGTAGHTIPHHLGVAPKMVISRKRSATGSWGTYHAGLTSASYYILLNDTAAQASNTVYFNGTAPTDSVVTRGTGADGNANGETYIQYAFAEIEGYSKISSYVGNGNADGSFVYTGFRPAWIMIKRIDSTGSWNIADAARSPFNEVDEQLQANLANAESTTFDFDFLSNGFKARTTDSARNASGGTYIYLAFAEAPFKFANAR